MPGKKAAPRKAAPKKAAPEIVKSKILGRISKELHKATNQNNFYAKDPTYDAYAKNTFLKGAPPGTPTHYNKAG